MSNPIKLAMKAVGGIASKAKELTPKSRRIIKDLYKEDTAVSFDVPERGHEIEAILYWKYPRKSSDKFFRELPEFKYLPEPEQYVIKDLERVFKGDMETRRKAIDFILKDVPPEPDLGFAAMMEHALKPKPVNPFLKNRPPLQGLIRMPDKTDPFKKNKR